MTNLVAAILMLSLADVGVIRIVVMALGTPSGGNPKELAESSTRHTPPMVTNDW